MTTLEKIKNCNTMIAEITAELKEAYIPRMEKCTSVQELRSEWGSILHDIGVVSSDEIPGIFNIELFYHLDRVRQLENKQ